MKYTFSTVTFAVALGAGAIGIAPLSSAEDRQFSEAFLQIAQAETLSEGEIRKVDKEAKKLTIKHGPISNLDMPSMTMVFQVKDPAMLDMVKAGDKVRFAADKISGAYVVTRIEPSR
jgi:Cu/Ag efflux protein CusF